MDTTLRFRRSLLHSLLATTALTTTIACGDDVATGTGGSGGSGGSTSDGGSGAQGSGGDSQGGAAQGGAAQGGAGQGGAAEGGAGGAPNPMDVERCFTIGDEACPTTVDAPTRFANCTETGEFVSSWDSGPVEKQGQCCYVVDLDLQNSSCGAIGRPFIVDGRAVTAPVRGMGAREDADMSILWGLDLGARSEIARLYALDAAYEHASVASFSKFSLELMRFGAPSHLLRGAHEAALDEVRHAELCLSLASMFAGADLAPAELPIAAEIALATDLEAFVVALVREGCMGETIASVIAAAQAERATHPNIKDAFRTIASDESKHAELAWRTLAWVVRRDPSMREVAASAFERAILEALSIPNDDARYSSPDHGRLSSGEEAVERRAAIDEVVRPTLRVVLG